MTFDADRTAAWIKRNGRVPLLALGGFALGLVVVFGVLAVMPDDSGDTSSPSHLNKISSAAGGDTAPAADSSGGGDGSAKGGHHHHKKDDGDANAGGGDAKASAGDDKSGKKPGELAKLFGKKDTTPKTPPTSVRIAPVKQENIAPQQTAVGNVIANQSVALIARVSSQITQVKFNAGDDVKAGQVLFVLDDREIKAALDQAKAKQAGDEAQLVSLKKELDRQQLGVTKGFASKSNLDVAQAQYATGQALVESDEASVESLEAQESYTTVTAPIDGRTGTINFTLGNIVRANDTVAMVTINQIKPISVQAALPQNTVDAVRAAQQTGPVTVVATTNSGKQVQGKLQYIDNAIDTTTGTYAVRAIFDNQDETLYPGTLVNISISLGQDQPQLTVPEAAIQHDQKGGDYVYVIDAQNTAHMTLVKVARIQNGVAVIADGLTAGQNVTTDGMMSIKDKGPVQINTTPEAIAADDTSGQAQDTPGASGLAPVTSADTNGAPDSNAVGQSSSALPDNATPAQATTPTQHPVSQ